MDESAVASVSRPRVLLLVRDRALVDLVVALLPTEGWDAQPVAALKDLHAAATDDSADVGLLDWSLAEGLLAEEHRPHLRRLSELLPLIVLVPARWAKLITAEDLGVAGVLTRPFDLAQLAVALKQAAALRERPRIPASS